MGYNIHHLYDLLLVIPFSLWYFRAGKAISGVAVIASVSLFIYMMTGSYKEFAFLPILGAVFCLITFIISDNWWPWDKVVPLTTEQEEALDKATLPDERDEKILQELGEKDEKEEYKILSKNVDAETRKKLPFMSPGDRLKMLEDIGRKTEQKEAQSSKAQTPFRWFNPGSWMEEQVQKDVDAEVKDLEELADEEGKNKK
jgi:hypothetical protein